LGDLNSANRYTYAGDDPVNAVDPTGTATISQWQFYFGVSCIVGAFLGVAALLLSTAGIGFPLIVLAAISGCLVGVVGAFVNAILAHYHLNVIPSP
jgi:hypothetical protein